VLDIGIQLSDRIMLFLLRLGWLGFLGGRFPVCFLFHRSNLTDGTYQFLLDNFAFFSSLNFIAFDWAPHDHKGHFGITLSLVFKVKQEWFSWFQ